MSTKYRHIKQYEKEIFELRNQGLTQREIAERLGFSKDQVKEFFHRYNRNQRKLAAGIAIKRKGGPPKDSVVTEQDKITELKYILGKKNGYTCEGFALI